jgi:hypothetical protein
MTKLKAFLICFIIPPVVTFGIPLMFPLEGGENLMASVWLLLWIPFVPLSLFAPAYAIDKRFRNNGLYGALTGAAFIAIILLKFFYHVI